MIPDDYPKQSKMYVQKYEVFRKAMVYYIERKL